jgi:uncharacterized repeat protein (TIGR03847 family)
VSAEGRASRFTAGAIGQPGQRTFYLFAEVDGTPMWFLAEKQQIRALGSQCLEALPQTGLDVDEASVERLVAAGLDLPWPSSPEDVRFRVDTMALRVDQQTRMITVIVTGTEDDQQASIDVSGEQLRAMALQALASVESGRPICPKCQLPEEPDGHECPSSNGHKSLE